MKSYEFRTKALAIINELEELTLTRMDDCGLIEEDSQKICVLNRIQDLKYTINGVQPIDMIVRQ